MPATVFRRADCEQLQFPGGASMRLIAEGVGTRATVTAHSAILRDGAQGASPHHHRSTTELIYVLAGSLQVLVGRDVVVATEGDLVVIPPGVTHAFAATHGHDAEILDVITPGVERFEQFRSMSLGTPEHTATTATTDGDNQSSYDAFADDSPAWNQAQQKAVTP